MEKSLKTRALIPIDSLSNQTLDHQPNPAFIDEKTLMDKEIWVTKFTNFLKGSSGISMNFKTQ